jgi:aromatic ring-opening dioxygenase catalytic subunit (LigB family)
MPTWFIPHGAGPCFFMEWNPINAWDRTADFLKGLAKTLPAAPKAIVMVSAHWLESSLSVTGSPNPELIYDYYGFPEHTYALQYPAKGEPLLAKAIVQRLKDAGVPASIHPSRGFDHGMFIPMLLMFPNADIPVVQLSLNSNLDAQTHLEIGKALASLRDEGVLMIGSGMSFHNMRGYGKPQFGPISDAFDGWLTQTVESDSATRNKRLADWSAAPFARQSHPLGEEEHLLPLMVAAGAASNGMGKRVFTDRVLETTLSAFTFN